MALPISTKTEQRYTPPGAEGDPAPVYLYRAPTWRQREDWRARMIAEVGDNPSQAEMRRHAETGIEALSSDETDRASLIDLYGENEAADRKVREIAIKLAGISRGGAEDDAVKAQIEALQGELEASRLDPATIGRLEELDAALRQGWPPYASALRRRIGWGVVGPRIAAKVFLTGWENVGVKFRRLNGEVPDEVLDGLPDGHVMAVGLTIINQMFAGPADAKKQDSPSGSAGSATSSSAKPESRSSAPAARDG